MNIILFIVYIPGRQVRSKTVPVPLSASSRLSWLGASAAGAPCAGDAAGALRLLDVAAGVWLPVCDTNAHCKGASDSWFIVSVSIGILLGMCVCMGSTRAPPTSGLLYGL